MSVSKVAKAIVFTAQAHEHHTSVKLRNVIKWLKSGHEVRVQITGKPDRQKAIDEIYGIIEKDIKSGARFIQKAVRPGSIKVILRPNEDSANLKVDDSKVIADIDKEISDMMDGKDIFSDDFGKDLLNSIKEERNKNKKK